MSAPLCHQDRFRTVLSPVSNHHAPQVRSMTQLAVEVGAVTEQQDVPSQLSQSQAWLLIP